MTTDHLRALIRDDHGHLVALRRDLHQHPELRYEEKRTCDVVCNELDDIGVEYVRGLAGGTGVLAHLPASDRAADKPAVALRADMDALPIHETTGVPYASKTEGVMHACGHDGHTTLLLGAARALAKVEHRSNPVTFMFQPAEEGGSGGKRMCEDGALDGAKLGPKVAKAYGLHGWPDITVGHVATRPGPLLAAVDTFNVVIRGVGGHAAYPHDTVDPVIAACHCVTALQSIAGRNIDPTDPVVVSVTGVQAGSADNVIPGEAVFFGTTRSHSDHVRDLTRERFHEIVQQTAAAFGCHAEIDWWHGYPVTYNDPETTAWFDALAKSTLGEDRVSTVPRAHMGGEDFSYYAQVVPSCFFLLGLRPADQDRFPKLHQPDFDFNDQAIPTGVELFCRIALDKKAI